MSASEIDYQALMAVQPAPTRRAQSVAILSDSTLQSFQDRGLPRVAELLKARKAFGLAKYGTPLYTYNGRDALCDSIQEVSGLLVYLVQLYEEANNPIGTPKDYLLLGHLLDLIISTGRVAEGILVVLELRDRPRTKLQDERLTDTL